MANVSDPLANTVSGSDPQNLMEYITRQKIYDGRFWKEECFGLTVADVLEKAATLECIGGLPTHFLALTLKLLQLYPETQLVIESFIQQDEFKYVQALGCLYVRLTGRPVEIYETLEPLYRDSRKLRQWNAGEWSITYMDDFIHTLLTSTHVVTIALPRLPNRRSLQDSGYLPEGPRPTALKDVLLEYGGPLEYLKHKALTEQNPAALEAWNQRQALIPQKEPKNESHKEERPKKKKQRNYGNLFKSSDNKVGDSNATSASQAATAGPVEGSDEYWNEQRARLGLKPLQK